MGILNMLTYYSKTKLALEKIKQRTAYSQCYNKGIMTFLVS